MGIDPIEELALGWKRELPELNTESMVTVARLNRLSAMLSYRIADVLTEHGSSLADFDVLSALRRHGDPYELMPSELSRRVMLSPSGMTHRLDLLESAGLVARRLDPSNRRSLPVALTPAGIVAAESLVRLVVEVESDMLKVISTKQRSALDKAAHDLLGHLSAEAPGSTTTG